MFRKKAVLAVTIVTLLVLIPVGVFAASMSLNGITLFYPDSGAVCEPDFVIHTTGVPEGGSVQYHFGYSFDGINFIWGDWQAMSGDLNVTYPYDWAPEGAAKYAVRVKAFDASGALIGEKDPETHLLRGKWDCTPPSDGAGCTPGYWKNHEEDWSATPYAWLDDFDATFGVDFFNPNITLGEAVWARGGGVNKAARHGTAALLNSTHPAVDYPYTTAEVIAIVQGGDIDDLVYANELGCDL